MLILGLRENRPIEITTPDGKRIVLTRLYQIGKGLQLGLELPDEYQVRIIKPERLPGDLGARRPNPKSA